jgi:hypothetical protein
MRTIQLTKGQVAIVDDEDYEKFAGFRWHARPHHSGGYYASRNKPKCRGTLLHLHCEVLGQKYVDHINGNKLDCRRLNLRPASHAQNVKNARRRRDNTSGFKGVSPHGNGWCATISCDKRRHHLGKFGSKLAAAIEYNIAAIQLHGEFASINDVFSGEIPL